MSARPHEWEQIDQSAAYCVRCPATTDTARNDFESGCPMADDKKDEKPKTAGRDRLPPEVKTELENLRRLVQTIQDRLHALTRA